MRLRVLTAMMAAAGLAGAMTMAGAGPAAAVTGGASLRAAAAPGAWSKAALLPGTTTLGSGDAFAGPVSCPSSGNCTAGGAYDDSKRAFVTSERNGRWGTAEEVPGLGALNTGDNADVAAISCGSPGNCVAAGSYAGPGRVSAWVAVQTGWHWGQAEQIRGLAALNTGGEASVGTVSCASPGNCAVGGTFLGDGDQFQAFLVTLSNGQWAKAILAPGTVALNVGGLAEVDAMSCRKAGDCSAAGFYRPSSTTGSIFVITEENGNWAKPAIEVPGLAHLNVDGLVGRVVLSCGSAGNCVVGSSYRDARGHDQAFLATQKDDHWNNAAEARGTGALNSGGSAQVTAIKCPSAGHCVAGGPYLGTTTHYQLFLITERNGTWGSAEPMPGIRSHNLGTSTQLYSISCNSVGNCSAGGYYENAAFREFAFVITESGGHWDTLTEVPGIGTLSPGGDSGIDQLSCPSSGGCVGVGYATSAAGKSEAFYVSRT
jgi:hypothetical protein